MVRIFKHYIPLSLIISGVLEAFACYLSVPLARYLNSYDSNIHFFNYTSLIFMLVVIFSMSAAGLYNRHLRENFKEVIFRIIFVLILVFFIMSFLFYLYPILFTARTSFVYALIITGMMLFLSRTLLYLTIEHDYFKQRVIVFGAGKKASHIKEIRRKSDKRNIKIIGFIAVEDEQCLVDKNNLINTPNGLLNYVVEHHIDEVIVALDKNDIKVPVDELLECKVNGIVVLDILTFFERQTGRIKLGTLSPTNLIFSDGFVQRRFDQFIKRCFDIIASILLLLVTWPIMIVTALAILMESHFKGSVFYKQKRVGLFDENFEVIKFRSMGMDAEKDGAQWAQEVDPRVTKVGNIIRKYRIDELPQLFNVLMGNMSFVGPRPERPEFVKELSQAIEYYDIRHYIKPGITGWAQICYPYGATQYDTRNKLEYDLYYMKNYSIFLDIMILLQTIQVVLWRQGAR
ncbi:MAG: TIGR03013 family PEP-CTERM/XrtA system glycosyltransferase [Gammaproteobacteria bacterium]|nr:TIGR03013 family PEP-CTERM/XrtA system glycosyltransferase [Gammaproteobacteria bacterium]